MGDRNALNYVCDLEKDPYTTYYFAGFPKESCIEAVQWDPILAAIVAGFMVDDK